jgi:surface protein
LEELDISNFDTSSVTSMGYMFSYCSSLKTIYVSEKFVTTSVTSSGYMFYRCNSIVGGNGTTFISDSIRYARIDTADTPGYFTLKT